ncbi:MAG: penicillin-binding protein activator [Pseudomonadota bacterium]
MQRWTPWLAACALLALSSCAQVPTTQPPPESAPQAQAGAAPAAAATGQTQTAPAVVQPAPVPQPGPAAQPAPLPPPKPPTIALILPAQTTPFARAAETVRQGFFAAQSVSGTNATIQLIELEDGPAQLANALASARNRGADIAVGPLTRDAVNALGSGRVAAPLPVVTLNLPESDSGLAPHVLAFGVSIEQEARQVVAVALRELPLPPPVGAPPAAPRFMVIVGESPLARRMGNAFRDALREAGQAATLYPMRVTYDTLQALSDAIAAARLEAVFLALEARDAAAVRPRLPPALKLYATSQVNLGGAEAALLAPELEGVNFVDMPWLLEPDHLAVVVHPKPEQALSGELQRLYALGIDAFRLAIEWAQGRRSFGLDGVTGALAVDRDRSARVERVPTLAVFRNGRVERLGLAR